MSLKSLLAAAAAAPMLLALTPIQALADTPTATTDVDSPLVTAQRREESANSVGMPIQAPATAARWQVNWVTGVPTRARTARKFRILDKKLYTEDGEVTPTMKVKRKFINAQYGDLIESMYRE